MRVIIAGSRTINNYNTVKRAISDSGFDITTVISGGANGVDKIGEIWAEENEIPIVEKLARWDDVGVKGAVIKTNKYGKKYNAKAGITRNEEMAKVADALIAVWDGESVGTANMIETAQKYDLQIYIHYV